MVESGAEGRARAVANGQGGASPPPDPPLMCCGARYRRPKWQRAGEGQGWRSHGLALHCGARKKHHTRGWSDWTMKRRKGRMRTTTEAAVAACGGWRERVAVKHHLHFFRMRKNTKKFDFIPNMILLTLVELCTRNSTTNASGVHFCFY